MKNKPFEEMNELLDFYGNLLTEKQFQVMNYYYLEDFSLTEISELLNISRSAILDNIKRSEKILRNYESKLNLCKKYNKRCEIYDKMIRDSLNEYVELLKKFD